MVVMIVMLSIYYFTMDRNSKETGNPGGDDGVPTVRYEEYETVRAEIVQNRQNLISQLQTIIVSTEVSSEEKNTAIETIKTINQMGTNEFSLESNLRTIGYFDVLVQSDEEKVTIRVLDSEHSLEEANTIIVMAKQQFGTAYDVNVTFENPDDY